MLCNRGDICKICKKTADSSQLILSLTLKKVHGSGNELKTKNRKRRMIRFNKSVLVKPGSISCPECNKPITEPKMKSHMKRMHGEKPFKCVDCHRGFHSEKYLRQHLTNHRKYPCKDNPEMPLGF